ncbi:hypothetical protein ACJX0J_026345, partial [Zea mays]
MSVASNTETDDAGTQEWWWKPSSPLGISFLTLHLSAIFLRKYPGHGSLKIVFKSLPIISAIFSIYWENCYGVF